MTLRQSDTYIIQATLFDVLLEVSKDSGHGFKIESFGQTIRISCPFHSKGGEAIPSCYFTRSAKDGLPPGFCHCFGCGYAAPIEVFISNCFGKYDGGIFGASYLIKNFAAGENERRPLDLKERGEIDETEQFTEYVTPCVCDYLTGRGIAKKIQKKFKTGLTEEVMQGSKHECVAFPIYYTNGEFAHYALRATDAKLFHYPKGVVKPVYGLNFMENEKSVFVTESIINALSLWSWGYPAIALNGTGTETQFMELIRSPMREFYLCYDGDHAGKEGIKKFMASVGKTARCFVIGIPDGEDVNSLGREQFEQCEVK